MIDERKKKPIFVNYILRKISFLSMEEGYIGDVEEEYQNRLDTYGLIRANIWLARQIILSIPGALILISNVLVRPVSVKIMSKWLENFAYRINMEISIFVIAAV